MLQTNDSIRDTVRNHYKEIAVQGINSSIGCCGAPTDYNEISSQLGYSAEELAIAPVGFNMGLGCGNPQAIAELKPGEIVVDLGSGGGFDCFLASRQVGDHGKVIGVDMTLEMVSKARVNAEKGGFHNAEFRLGEIEHLPIANNTVDVIISNCVINLSPNKSQVFHEAYRVLKAGGRLAISDIVTTAELPQHIKNDIGDLYSGCISGASSIEEVKIMLEQSGFTNISVMPKDESKSFIKQWVDGVNIEDYIVSAVIRTIKA